MAAAPASQCLVGGALAAVDDGSHEVDCRRQYEDRKPATVGLGDQFGRQGAAQDSRQGGLRRGRGCSAICAFHALGGLPED